MNSRLLNEEKSQHKQLHFNQDPLNRDKNVSILNKASQVEAILSNVSQPIKTQSTQRLSKLLQEKQSKISELSRKLQIQTTLRIERENEINEFKTRDIQLTRHYFYIKQAEERRRIAFQQIKKLIQGKNIQLQICEKQLQQSVEKSKLKLDQLNVKQEVISRQFKINSLEQELSLSKRIDQQKQNIIEQMKNELSTLKGDYEKREQERLLRLDSIQDKYRQLEQSFSRQKKSLTEKHQRQIADLKKSKTQQQTKYKELKNKLSERIGNQSILRDQIERQLRQISDFKFQMPKLKTDKQNLQRDLRMCQQKLNQAIEKLNKSESLKAEKIQQQLSKYKDAYQKKSSQLASSFSLMQKNLKENYQQQKQMMVSEQFKKRYQLENKIMDLAKAKIAQLEDFRQANKQYARKIAELSNQLQQRQKEVIRYLEIIKKIKTYFHNLPNFNPDFKNSSDDKHLPNQIQDYIEQLYQQMNRAVKAQQDAMDNLVDVVEVCGQNKRLLKTIEDKLKLKHNILDLGRSEERSDDGNHLGIMINSVIDKIMTVVYEKEIALLQVQQKVRSLESNVKQNKSESEGSKLWVTKLQQQLKNLQSQYTSLSIQHQTQKKARQNIQQKLKKSLHQNTLRSLQIQQIERKLKTADDCLKRQHQNSQQLQLKMQADKKTYQQKINQLSEELIKNGKLLSQAQDETNLKNQLNRKLNQKISQLSEQIKTYQLKNKWFQKEIEGLKRQAHQREVILREKFEQDKVESMDRICKVVKEVYGGQPPRPNVDDIQQFLQKNGGKPTISAFSVSQILQKMPKERSFLAEQCSKFFGVNSITTKLSFKWDQFYKNFSNYLPTSQNKFLFAVVMKTKKNVVFGIISYCVGRESKAFAFNMNTMKIMHKSPRSRVPSTNYESSMLKFGNEEVIIKNNSNLEIRINTMIIGERYFEFSKEELVGRDEEGEVALEAMEVHRLIAI